MRSSGWLLAATATGAVGMAACGNEVTVLSSSTDGEYCTPGATQPCYGPGQCAGIRICGSDGTAWSSCYCGSGASGNTGGYGATGNAGGWGATGNWGGYGAYGNAGGYGAYGNAGGSGASGNWGGYGATGGGSPACVPEICNGFDDNCDGIIDNGIVCSCDVLPWAGHTYLFCQDPMLTWWQARDACHASGGHLLTINDAAEGDWASQQVDAHGGDWWWMGLNDLAAPGHWVWEDGTPISYTNWQPGEPSGGGEHCGHLGAFLPQSTWNDCTCTDHHGYVCEREQPPSQTNFTWGASADGGSSWSQVSLPDTEWGCTYCSRFYRTIVQGAPTAVFFRYASDNEARMLVNGIVAFDDFYVPDADWCTTEPCCSMCCDGYTACMNGLSTTLHLDADGLAAFGSGVNELVWQVNQQSGGSGFYTEMLVVY